MFNIVKRLLFILLFIGAMYSTWANISNLSIKDVDDWLALKQQTSESENNHKITNPSSQPAASYSATEEDVVELLNLSQYPARTVTATGYTAGYESTGKNEDHPAFGITYSGVEVKRDLYSTIAADIEIFPIGTVLFIPGYGYGVVADTGSAIKGDKIDLYYPSVDDVYDHWGKKETQVYVIEEGDGTLAEEELIHYNNNETLEVFREQILAE
ncbi:3D domain-containing protein [Halobacillus sp. A1]|uniref:3D domain-containing protein n=1 Tax=Halobacillus sp. A1 TaxID=2880262 RepID=UPI0020A6B654|nr:3D domain-containing protein [Halobacillus sp. A1]MCP3032780.1 3D domain-containing protein [Halobacillus sp. A1]